MQDNLFLLHNTKGLAGCPPDSSSLARWRQFRSRSLPRVWVSYTELASCLRREVVLMSLKPGLGTRGERKARTVFTAPMLSNAHVCTRLRPHDASRAPSPQRPNLHVNKPRQPSRVLTRWDPSRNA